MAILGLPRVSLQVAADAPLADWFVRLSDVAPDGRVTMVTGAGINGAQRDSHGDAGGLGARQDLSDRRWICTWHPGCSRKGHRIRIAVSNVLWPMNWPTPYPMTTAVMLGGDSASRIILPRVPVHGPAAPAFAAPEPIEAPAGITGIGGGGAAWPGEWTVLRDEARQRSTVIWKGATAVVLPLG